MRRASDASRRQNTRARRRRAGVLSRAQCPAPTPSGCRPSPRRPRLCSGRAGGGRGRRSIASARREASRTGRRSRAAAPGWRALTEECSGAERGPRCAGKASRSWAQTRRLREPGCASQRRLRTGLPRPRVRVPLTRGGCRARRGAARAGATCADRDGRESARLQNRDAMDRRRLEPRPSRKRRQSSRRVN